MNLATLAEANLRKYGEYDRLIFEDRTYTNRDLHERSCRLASALADLGIDERVVVMMPNGPEVLVSYPAIWRAGLVVVPVLFLLESHELRYILEDSRAKAIITSPEMVSKVKEAAAGLPTVERIFVTGEAGQVPDGMESFERVVADHEPMAVPVFREGHDLAVVLYTSGTTGKPKGVMQTHHNLHANALNSWRTAKTRDPKDVSLLVLPLAHSFGLGVAINGYLFGGKAVLMRWFDPEQALALIEKHRVRAMAGVPTMFVYMLHHPEADRYDTSSMERWLVGAAPMPAEQLRQFEAKFGGHMYVGYGLSEACPGVAVEREDLPRKPGSCGVPIEGVEVKVVDEAGQEVPRGQMGEVIARGENISPGYYEMPEATKETFRQGWLHTGDMGFLDEDGYLFIVERKKDLIIRGGFNIYPKDVEEVLYRHPAVQEAAVVGVPHEMLGEEVCAFVVLGQGKTATAEELIGHCQGELAKYKTPRRVVFLDAMPKTLIGKIIKKELRRMARA
ncbi:MAG: class I adenylate-forming enzyme family protein [Myxococcota bacterium]